MKIRNLGYLFFGFLLALVFLFKVVECFQWYPRRHINEEAFGKIRLDITTEAQVLKILGPPNQPPWDYTLEGYDDAYSFFDEGWHEMFWYGNYYCLAVAFDEQGIVRGRRKGTIKKLWFSSPIRE